MSLPVVRLLPEIQDREYALCAVYGHKLLFCLGLSIHDRANFSSHRIRVYNMATGRWTSHACRGEKPPFVNMSARVLEDCLYLILEGSMAVYTLNLKTFVWDKLGTSGALDGPVQPIKSFMFLTWAWQGKIYIYGGLGRRPDANTLTEEQKQITFEDEDFGGSTQLKSWNNQCIAFNKSTQRWEWPEWSSGRPPGSRFIHQCITIGDLVLMFGGEELATLHVLHLPSRSWSSLKRPELASNAVCPSSLLAAVGETRALLMPLNCDCERKRHFTSWILSWSPGASGMSRLVLRRWHIWPLPGLYWPDLILSPDGTRVYMIGSQSGCCTDYPSILVKPLSLYEACMEAINRNRSRFNQCSLNRLPLYV